MSRSRLTYRDQLKDMSRSRLTRYPLKQRRAPSRYASQYVLLTNEDEPECYEEAMEDEQKEKWQNAMQDEIDSLHEIILMTW